jgi:hypothetical protein
MKRQGEPCNEVVHSSSPDDVERIPRGPVIDAEGFRTVFPSVRRRLGAHPRYPESLARGLPGGARLADVCDVAEQRAVAPRFLNATARTPSKQNAAAVERLDPAMSGRSALMAEIDDPWQ